jgi:hypothetical protein
MLYKYAAPAALVCEWPSGQSHAGLAKNATRVAPSPWGAGRVEGGRNSNLCLMDLTLMGLVLIDWWWLARNSSRRMVLLIMAVAAIAVILYLAAFYLR